MSGLPCPDPPLLNRSWCRLAHRVIGGDGRTTGGCGAAGRYLAQRCGHRHKCAGAQEDAETGGSGAATERGGALKASA
jgi:hypothetical protein